MRIGILLINLRTPRLATFPMVFQQSYDQSIGRASLNYLSLGVGFIVGLQVSGPLQDAVSLIHALLSSTRWSQPSPTL